MLYPSRKCAFRRESNSHEAAEPRAASYLQPRAGQRTSVKYGRIETQSPSVIRKLGPEKQRQGSGRAASPQ